LQHIAATAVAENCGRFEWSVLDWNKPSIDFYESMGAVPQSEWIIYRLTGQALQEAGRRSQPKSANPEDMQPGGVSPDRHD
jgi:hypothetical protein